MSEISRTRRRRSSSMLLIGLALAAVSLPGCGGGGDSSPSAPSTPTVVQPITTNLPAQQFLGMAPGDVRFFAGDVVSNVTGTLTASLNWTFASNDLDLFVTTTACNATGVVSLQACARIGLTTSTTAKPEVLTVNVTRGTTYRIWAANFGPSSESGTVSITVTGTP